MTDKHGNDVPPKQEYPALAHLIGPPPAYAIEGLDDLTPSAPSEASVLGQGVKKRDITTGDSDTVRPIDQTFEIRDDDNPETSTKTDVDEDEIVPGSSVWEWWIFRYDPPTISKARAWAHMYAIVAPLIAMVSLILAVTSAASAAERNADIDSSSHVPLGPAGVSAVIFGVISAILLFVAAVTAFLSSHYAKASDPILPGATVVFVVISMISVLLLVAASISASVEARRSPLTLVTMTVLCVLASAVGIPIATITSLSVTISIFMRHLVPTFCDDIPTAT